MDNVGIPRSLDRTLATSAALCAALVFAVVASSAWLRLAPGAPCPVGACDGFTLADGVRLTHRVAAMAVSVVALLIAWVAWARRPASWGLRATSVAILVLVAGLAALGRSSAGTPTTPVMLGNLIGGMALLGLSTALACAGMLATPGRHGRLHGQTAAATALVVASIVTGAGLAALPGEASGWLRNIHFGLGWLLPVGWAALAGRAAAQPEARRAAALTAVLVIAATALATLGPERATSPLTAWLHNVLAAATLCAALAATARSRSRA